MRLRLRKTSIELEPFWILNQPMLVCVYIYIYWWHRYWRSWDESGGIDTWAIRSRRSQFRNNMLKCASPCISVSQEVRGKVEHLLYGGWDGRVLIFRVFSRSCWAAYHYHIASTTKLVHMPNLIKTEGESPNILHKHPYHQVTQDHCNHIYSNSTIKAKC